MPTIQEGIETTKDDNNTIIVHSSCTSPTTVTPSHNSSPTIHNITQEEDLPTDYTEKSVPRRSTRIQY